MPPEFHLVESSAICLFARRKLRSYPGLTMCEPTKFGVLKSGPGFVFGRSSALHGPIRNGCSTFRACAAGWGSRDGRNENTASRNCIHISIDQLNPTPCSTGWFGSPYCSAGFGSVESCSAKQHAAKRHPASMTARRPGFLSCTSRLACTRPDGDDPRRPFPEQSDPAGAGSVCPHPLPGPSGSGKSRYSPMG